MKTLLLLRHAKSSWATATTADFNRSLNERGIRTAPVIGKLLKDDNLTPDLIICSPARRTRQTLELVIEATGWEIETRFDSDIYEASTGALLEILSGVDDGIESILMIGHNPGLEDLIRNLTGEIYSFPTAGLAKISLAVESWENIVSSCGKLEMLIKPKEIEI